MNYLIYVVTRMRLDFQERHTFGDPSFITEQNSVTHENRTYIDIYNYSTDMFTAKEK